MIVDISCSTDRFNLSCVGPDFINDCCFGEDFSQWLTSALSEVDVEAGILCMEDFGWANDAKCQGVSYLMCVAGSSEGDPNRPDYGEWHVMLKRRRTLMQRLIGKNRATAKDLIVDKIVQVLRGAGFDSIMIESR